MREVERIGAAGEAPRIPDASSPRGFFLGEQMGLFATGHGFTSTWAAPDTPARAAAYVQTTG